MFTELMPILKSRPVTITIASVDKTKIRVNVIPKAVDSDSRPDPRRDPEGRA